MKVSNGNNLHKHFIPKDRKFIIDWQKSRNIDLFEHGKNVLLVDDVISDGATLFEMFNTLKELEVNVIGCITLFKTTK